MQYNVKIGFLIFCCLSGMFGYVYIQKKQFFPTVVYLSKSGAAIAAFYAEAAVLGLIVSSILQKLFFGQLRPIESERLAERSWYALTETCLAFTIFKEDPVPVFIFQFGILIMMKTLHWLTEERVNLIERSFGVSRLLHCRLISVFLLLGAVDIMFILHAYQVTMSGGASLQIVFGFEFCILHIMLLNNLIKYVLFFYATAEHNTTDTTVVQMYVTVVMNSIKVILYTIFFLLMVQIFTFPLFVVRPMYFTLKAFKKSVMNVLMMRRAMRYLNSFYPDVTPSDLNVHDNACIICREELTMQSKKLPCNHIFHTACLRAWFQRQQTCPTCRYNILKDPQTVQVERLRHNNNVHVAVQTDPEKDSMHTHIENSRIFGRYLDEENVRHSRSSLHLDQLTHEELKNIENSLKEEVKEKLRKLSDLSSILDAGTYIIQQLPPNSGTTSNKTVSTQTCINNQTEDGPANMNAMFLEAERTMEQLKEQLQKLQALNK